MIKNLFETLWLTLFAHKALSRWNYYMMNLFQKNLGINNYKSDIISGELYWAKYVLNNYSIDLIFDIGAHKGDYTKIYRDLGYKGLVYLSEPHPETYKVLSQKMKDSDMNHCLNIGFSDKEGTQLIYDQDMSSNKSGSPHATIYADVITDMHKYNTIQSTEVFLTTLDSFVKNNNIDKISLLKIDTEGNEFPILKGAERLLKEKKIDFIQIEFGEMNVASRYFFKDFYDLLNHSYYLYRLLPNDLLPINVYNSRYCEIFIYQNIVAIRKDIKND